MKAALYIFDCFVLASGKTHNRNAKRFLLNGKVLAKRTEDDSELDNYFVSIDKNVELKVYQQFYNSCKEGD